MKNRILGYVLCAGVLGSSLVGVPLSACASTVTEALPGAGLDLVRGASGDQKRVYETGTQINADQNASDTDADIRDEINSLIAEETEDIYIRSADDLISLAADSRLDTWSVNKRVRLESDISLTGKKFSGIPTFGGVFDGRGHTISGLDITQDKSYLGLFIYLQESATVMNLNVEGHVSSGNRDYAVGGIAASNAGTISNCSFDGVVAGGDYIGGIAGFNELSGRITGCRAEGYVSGNHFTGGIAGQNMGDISECTNFACINTTHRERTLSVKDINIETYVNSAIDLNEDTVKENPSVFGTIYDTGGIAGMSIGVIRNCTNEGLIGYEQVGYNTGGIAGRQSGYITGCVNNGEILGRKDVGGIVGQAEPYVAIDVTQDIAASLNENIGILHDLINDTLADIGNESNTISSRLALIKQFTGNALNDTRYLADDTANYINGVTGSVNEAFSRIDYIMEESSKDGGALDQTINAAANAYAAGTKISAAVDDLNIYDYMTDEEKAEYDGYKKKVDDANKEYNDYLERSKKALYNYYLWKYSCDELDFEGENDLVYLLSDTDGYTFNSKSITLPPERAREPFTWSSANYPENDEGNKDDFFDTFGTSGTWYHHTEADGDFQDISFPINDKENDRYAPDRAIDDAARVQSAVRSAAYADSQYKAAHGTSYEADLAKSADGISALIMKYIPVMSEEIKKDADSAVGYIQSSVKSLENAGKETKRVVGDVASKDSIAFPTLGSDYRSHTASLADNLQGMNDNFGILNSEMNSATGDMVTDLSDVNDQFNKIMLLYSDAIDGVLDRDYSNVIEDESLEEAETCTDATVADCTNNARICGDIDTGGITGTMAIEYDFDPESDVTGISNADMNTTFIAKCVLRNNKNTGNVEGKKSYVAGVCALQEMGTVTGCENYGDIDSASGEYAGGIAGQSLSYILKGISKGDIHADKYAGGIAGEGTHIMDSIALVNIPDTGSWYGAVAGHITDKGKVRNNYFVNTDLAGIDRVDYSMKAQPTDLSSLGELVPYDIPEEFMRPKVTYLLEDGDETQILGSVSVRYGGSLISEEYPEVEPKDGYYVSWDAEQLDNITSDTKIRASYVRSITTLAGSELNDHGQSYVLVDGNFKEGDRLEVEKYLSENGEVIDDTLIMDSFLISIPFDGNTTHTVRYALDDEHQDDWEGLIDAYVIRDGKWTPADPITKMGKYLLFDVEGNNVKIQIRMNDYARVMAKTKAILILSAVGVLAVTGVIIFIFIKRRRKIARAVKVIRNKTHEAAANLGSQELFYHAEEDRFGNEVVHDTGDEAENDDDNNEGSGGTGSEDDESGNVTGNEPENEAEDEAEDESEDEDGSSDWGL